MTDTIRILVADDHPLMRSGLVAVFNAQPDMRVVAEADGGREAIEAFRQHQPDVALVDLRMPAVDGVDVTIAVLKEYPAARIVILSSFDGDEDIYRAFKAGAVTYALKETSPQEIVDLVRSVSRGQTPIAPEIRNSLAVHEDRESPSAREREILKLVALGLSNRDIAIRLDLSENTVRFHLKALFAKLGVNDRTAAVVIGLQKGLLRLD